MAESKTYHRLPYGVVAFVLQLFLGLIYGWSLFIAPLEADFGWARSDTSLIFTISMVFFCVGNLAAGTLSKRLSPRAIILLAAACAAVGFAASSLTEALPWIFVSYGVLCGFAVGVAGNCSLATALKWFPDRQAIASGCMLMGMGFGSMVLGPPVNMLIAALGWRTTFQILAVAFFVVLAASAVILRVPPEEYSRQLLSKARERDTVAGRDYTLPEMVRTGSFWLYMIWIILVSAGGLALISNAVPAASDILVLSMDQAAALAAATSAMGAISAFNGLGKFGLGLIWDKLGYRRAFVIISLVYAAAMALCSVAVVTSSLPLIVAGFVLLGLAYGGSISSSSAVTGSFFGPKNYSMNYACITCQMIVASAIGPTIAGAFKTATGSYLGAYLVFLAFAMAALLLQFVVRRPKDAEAAPAGEASPASE